MHDFFNGEIISLLAVSVIDNDDNVELVKDKEKNLLPCIYQIINNSTADLDRYIPCLQLIACLSNASTDIADFFIVKGVHKLMLT